MSLFLKYYQRYILKLVKTRICMISTCTTTTAFFASLLWLKFTFSLGIYTATAFSQRGKHSNTPTLNAAV